MRKTRILLSGKINIQYYIDAVEACGAEAVRYSPDSDVDCDGLIICGGSDLNPMLYNEEINGSVGIDDERDAAEFALLRAYIDAGKAVMGICRGHQLINVFFGGTLHQDIQESQIHKSHDGIDSVHSVTAVSDSVLSGLYGEHFFVNSSHHQAIKDLGKGLRITALWNSEYVEAIEHTELPIIAVQWHPERMCFSKKREDTVDGEVLFRYFIDMCR